MAPEGRRTLFDGYDLGEDRDDDEFGHFSSQEYQEQEKVYFSQDDPYGTQNEQGGEDMEDVEVSGMIEDLRPALPSEEVVSPGETYNEETQQVRATPVPGSPNETRQKRGYNRHGRNGTYKCPACRFNHKLCVFADPDHRCDFCLSKKLLCGPKVLKDGKVCPPGQRSSNDDAQSRVAGFTWDRNGVWLPLFQQMCPDMSLPDMLNKLRNEAQQHQDPLVRQVFAQQPGPLPMGSSPPVIHRRPYALGIPQTAQAPSVDAFLAHPTMPSHNGASFNAPTTSHNTFSMLSYPAPQAAPVDPSLRQPHQATAPQFYPPGTYTPQFTTPESCQPIPSPRPVPHSLTTSILYPGSPTPVPPPSVNRDGTRSTSLSTRFQMSRLTQIPSYPPPQSQGTGFHDPGNGEQDTNMQYH